MCVAPPTGAAAAVCSAAGDKSSPGGAAGGRTCTLLHRTGAGEGQSSAASQDHGCGSGGWSYVCVRECLSAYLFTFVIIFECEQLNACLCVCQHLYCWYCLCVFNLPLNM